MENPRIMIKSDGINTELFIDGEMVKDVKRILFNESLDARASKFVYEKAEINEFGRVIRKSITKEFNW